MSSKKITAAIALFETDGGPFPQLPDHAHLPEEEGEAQELSSKPKQRHKEGKHLAQGHTGSKQQNWFSNF